MKKYYNLCVDKENGEADLYIFGDITSWRWMESDVSSYSLSKELESLSDDVKSINVYINSCGGEVSEALAIRSQLKRHKAKVKTYCDGIAASAAVTIFMAGDERIMSNTGLLFIHNAWVETCGDSNKLKKEAEALEKITQASITAYMEHINISEEELKQMLDNETWIAPQEALEKGFITTIVNEKDTNGASQSVKKSLIKMIKEAQAKIKLFEPTKLQEPKQTKEPIVESIALDSFLNLIRKGEKK